MSRFKTPFFTLIATSIITLVFCLPVVAQNVVCHMPQGGASIEADSGCTVNVNSGASVIVKSGGTFTAQSGSTSSITRSVERMLAAFQGKAGLIAGWAFPSAHSGFTNAAVVGLPASQTASTFVIPIDAVKVGETITAFSVQAQIESAGGAVTLDADLRKITTVAGDSTDVSIGAITQVAVTADTKVAASKTLATPEVVAADEMYYILVTGTTAASTDIQLSGITLTVTEN